MNVPPSLEERVQWLVDRAQISELLFSYAREIDEKNWQGHFDLYSDDAKLELPWVTISKDEMPRFVPRDLGRFAKTHHISTNHQIEIDGDTARSRSYLHAQHVWDPEDQSTQWILAGWYDNEYRREGDGWKITRVRITPVWEAGQRPPLEGGDQPDPA